MASLRDLGLSKYEARAYRSLLEHGPTTAKALSDASGVPMGRIYDVLNGLAAVDLVRSQAAGRPKKYAAVEPETALTRLVETRRRELDRQAERYETVASELVAELDATSPDEQFWTVAVGSEDTVDLLVERLASAQGRIRHVAGPPSPGIDLGAVGRRILKRFESALEDGVDVMVLLDPALVESIPDDLQSAYAARLADREGFEIRAATGVDGSFTLVDAAEVCIEVPNPLDPEEAFALIDFTDPEFAADVRQAFDDHWTAATALDLERVART
jgi:sugar-specific transcriptional regulator TrmB